MSIVTRIADVLEAAGLVDRPHALPASTMVEVQQEKRRIDWSKQSQVVQAKSYDPDKEFEGLLTPDLRPFDMTFEKDTDGTPIAAISAQLYEVSADGKAYRLKKYVNKSDLLEAIAKAQQDGKDKDDLDLAPPWALREADVYERDRAIDDAAREMFTESMRMIRDGHSLDEVKTKLREADLLREDAFAGGYRGGYDGYGQDYYRGPGSQYGSGRDLGQEYIPIMGGPWSKQLYLYQYLDMHAKAFEAYNHNPLAHQLIMLTTYYTLGRGIDHTCTNIEVDEVIREFVDRTDFYSDLMQIANDLWWCGELINEWYDNVPKKGLTDYRTVDPSTIWEIITDPEDFKKVYYYHQQYSTPYQNYITGAPPDKQPAAVKYIIRQIPADQCYHVKINCCAWEKRGRTDLFSVLGWLKRYKDLLNARVVKGQLEAAFVWDVLVTSGEADVESIGAQLPDPFNPGATFIHTKAMELKPQSSQMRGNDASPDIDHLTATIATGVGTPKEFIGTSGKGARAGILASTEPGTKRYEARQMLIEKIAHTFMDRVITNAANAGIIDLDEVLADARTVKRLAVQDDTMDDMDDKRKEMEKKNDDYTQQQQDQAAQQAQMQHEQTLALAGQPTTNGASLVNVNRDKPPAQQREALAAQKTQKLTTEQKARIEAIKKTGKFSRELIEFSFPSIAQEDRSAKLKDLALAEAMEWLPKSIVATLAAKELNITTYEFAEMWAMIVDEAKKGMSIAHVFGQDNKHVPDVAISQAVQEENQAEQPVAQQPLLNVPAPPVVAGMKQEPNPNAKPGAGGGNGVPPGQKPNSGDSKTNLVNRAARTPPNPTSPSNGYSKAANSPMTNEGRANIKKREAMMTALYGVVLKEAIGPMMTIRSDLARLLLERPDVVREFEEAAESTKRNLDESESD